MEEFGTILAVDDTKENLDILLHILSDFDVIPATSAAAALELAKSEDISLILLDIVMPGMDGYEAARLLRQDEKTKDIPIIFITSNSDEESIVKAYDVGGNDYISKPLKRKEVLARVKTQLLLRQHIAQLEFLASRDTMTGAYNRRKFFELAVPAFEGDCENFFGCMIDIDDLKK